jgi:hypothetical protein
VCSTNSCHLWCSSERTHSVSSSSRSCTCRNSGSSNHSNNASSSSSSTKNSSSLHCSMRLTNKEQLVPPPARGCASAAVSGAIQHTRSSLLQFSVVFEQSSKELKKQAFHTERREGCVCAHLACEQLLKLTKHDACCTSSFTPTSESATARDVHTVHTHGNVPRCSQHSCRLVYSIRYLAPWLYTGRSDCKYMCTQQ